MYFRTYQRAPLGGDMARVTFCCLWLTNDRVQEMLGWWLPAQGSYTQSGGTQPAQGHCQLSPRVQPAGSKDHGWIDLSHSEKNTSAVSFNMDPWQRRQRDLNKHIPPPAGPWLRLRLSIKFLAGSFSYGDIQMGLPTSHHLHTLSVCRHQICDRIRLPVNIPDDVFVTRRDMSRKSQCLQCRALTLRKQLDGWETSQLGSWWWWRCQDLRQLSSSPPALEGREEVSHWNTESQFPHQKYRDEIWIIGGESLTNNDPMGEICSTLAVSGLPSLLSDRILIVCIAEISTEFPNHDHMCSHELHQSDHWKLTHTAAKTI